MIDREAARAFYVDRLGFSLAFCCGEPPFYARVGRGSARLDLRFVPTPAFAADHAREIDPLSASITIDIPCGSGVPIAREPIGSSFMTGGNVFVDGSLAQV